MPRPRCSAPKHSPPHRSSYPPTAKTAAALHPLRPITQFTLPGPTSTPHPHTCNRPMVSCNSHLSDSDRCEFNLPLGFRKNLMHNGLWAASWAPSVGLQLILFWRRPYPGTIAEPSWNHSRTIPSTGNQCCFLRMNCDGTIPEPSRNHPWAGK